DFGHRYFEVSNALAVSGPMQSGFVLSEAQWPDHIAWLKIVDIKIAHCDSPLFRRSGKQARCKLRGVPRLGGPRRNHGLPADISSRDRDCASVRMFAPMP